MKGSKLKISAAQQRILDELKKGKVIIEANYKGTLKYETSYISKDCPWGFGRPRRVRKESVWVLISLGLIEEEPLPWPNRSMTTIYKQYVLQEFLR